MAKKARLPQSRRHIMIFDEDWEYLMREYGPGSANSELGISGALKELIHQRVLGLRDKANQKRDSQ